MAYNDGMEHQRDLQTGSPLHEDPLLGEDSNQSRLDRYQRDLERAQRELQEEKHKPLGLYDDIVNLFCFIETPEERLHKNRLALSKVTVSQLSGSSQESPGSTTPTFSVVGRLAKRAASVIAEAVS